jgi:hypothetical protein
MATFAATFWSYLGLNFIFKIAVKALGHRSGTEGVTESRLLMKRGSSRA